MPSTHTAIPAKVKIEMSSDLLMQLIYQGQVKGNDCRCLDANTKQVLWLSLLNSSVDTDEVSL
ncbi:hypothetical protein [Thalassotalea euphylliae]|uniref:hypothetical protein n=1 Tax=Thalassotalea euphylliae TaxID=1655234 RepID=UPI0011C06F25|nr:hypothetical protein [Thalassotalea euphylliae]